MYMLDPFVIIAEADGGSCQFIGGNTQNVCEFPLNNAQMSFVQSLSLGNAASEEEIRAVLPSEMVDAFFQLSWFTDHEVDRTSIDSRTHAFFRAHNMENGTSALKDKSVMVLGTGGIGTHLAWHLVLLGVGHLTLVDYDTVEESNLNRQLLFDRNDIGKEKVDVVCEKLLRIRPDADIRAVNLKIDSLTKLEELCTERHLDLLVKALDTPSEFPMWLDTVAKKNSIPYVSAITMLDKTMVGPTFLPGTSEIGWSDIVPVSHAKRIAGISPSIGIMLGHIATAVAVECFKVLTGYGVLQYLGRVAIENIFTAESYDLMPGGVATDPASPAPPTPSVASPHLLLAEVAGMFCLSILSFFYLPALIPAILYGVCAPLLLSLSRTAASRAAFINMAIVGLAALTNGIRYLAANSVPVQYAFFVVLGIFMTVSVLTVCACALIHMVRRDPTR